MGFFKNIGAGLKKIGSLAGGFGQIDDEYYDELEEQLIVADVGVTTAGAIVEALRARVKEGGIREPSELKPVIKEIIAEMLTLPKKEREPEKPEVILMIGVNGVGKTTTIGKLAKLYAESGKRVVLAAADTFRAAAIDQLEIWGARTGSEVVKHAEGSDPAAVVHDALEAGKARNADVVICDTAGRLHNKKNLMDELSKIRRVIDKELPGSHPQVLLVVDATTGQNALNQARQFQAAAGITGIVLTKLDGTAKGGVVVAIVNEVKVPVLYAGVGEGANDLHPFDAAEFVNVLFGDEDER